MTLNSEFFASIRRRVLYYNSPGGACRALTFALARLSCYISFVFSSFENKYLRNIFQY